MVPDSQGTIETFRSRRSVEVAFVPHRPHQFREGRPADSPGTLTSYVGLRARIYRWPSHEGNSCVTAWHCLGLRFPILNIGNALIDNELHFIRVVIVS